MTVTLKNNLDQPVNYDNVNILPLKTIDIINFKMTPSIQDAINRGIISIVETKKVKIKNRKEKINE